MEEVMNLYVLKVKSLFYLLLKHAWINFKLVIYLTIEIRC